MKELRPRIDGSGMRMINGLTEWTLSDLLYADDLVLVSGNESELRMMIDAFDVVCKGGHTLALCSRRARSLHREGKFILLCTFNASL